MMLKPFHFDKEKYIQLLKTENSSVALTTLQNDIIAWEYEAFEGELGYQPKMVEELEVVRTFSRELWQLAIQSESEKKFL